MSTIRTTFLKNLFYLSLFSLLLLPKTALAHPIDEIGDVRTYDQSQTLTLGKNQTRLTIDLTFYPLDKMKVWESIDTNYDRLISETEKNSWMRLGQNSSWLEVDSQRFDFTAVNLTFPDYYEFFAMKPALVSIKFITIFKLLPDTPISYHYQGKDKQLSEIEFSAHGQDNLQVVRLTKISPQTINIVLGAGPEVDNKTLNVSTNNRLNQFLQAFVKPKELPLTLIIVAAGVAFVIGALHALTPGHGKTIVASYLIGEGGTVTQALSLGLIVTVTHTLSVFILGFLTLIFTQFLVPQTITKTLTFVSGLLVVGFGLILVFQRLRDIFFNRTISDHQHAHIAQNINWKSLLTLGITGGMVPCADALAILIVAASLQKILLGLTLLVTFSLGLALALISLGLLAVVAKNSITKHFAVIVSYQNYLRLFSAVVVTLLGLFMLING